MNRELQECLNGLKLNGYYIFKDVVSSKEIRTIQEERDNILKEYSEETVKQRLFYKREDSYNRQGDAVQISFAKSELPSITVKQDDAIGKYMKLYQNIVSNAVGEEFRPEYRCMLNSQQYFEHSLPVHDHYDMEAFDFEHVDNSKHNEYALKLKSALIPRYVMVVVLTNENDGLGTYVRQHDSNERIDVKLYPGDVLIFDNIRYRHGVPELNNPRSMIGFRSMDFSPVLFEEHPEGGNKWYEIQDELNPGWGMEITSEEAKTIMLDFNKKWQDELFDIFIKKPAAF